MIISRKDPHQESIERLQKLLNEKAHDFNPVPASLSELVDRVEKAFDFYSQELDSAESRIAALVKDNLEILASLEVVEDTLSTLIGAVDFDDAMDHATADLMDCICSSGAADISADGEIVFDERISLKKEDLKPMLREAIVRWIEVKMSS
jgi:hypothetical protein